MKTKIRRKNWGSIKEAFIQRRLANESLSLASYAKELKIPLRTLEKHSASEGWLAAVEQRAQERLDAVQRHSERVQEHLVSDERALRAEHATLFRILNNAATAKLERLTEDDLSIDEMIEIFRWVPAEMRMLAGFADPRMTKKAAAEYQRQQMQRRREATDRMLQESEERIARNPQMKKLAQALSGITITEAEADSPQTRPSDR